MAETGFCADGCGAQVPKQEPSTSTTEPLGICYGCWNYRMEKARKARSVQREGKENE